VNERTKQRTAKSLFPLVSGLWLRERREKVGSKADGSGGCLFEAGVAAAFHHDAVSPSSFFFYSFFRSFCSFLIVVAWSAIPDGLAIDENETHGLSLFSPEQCIIAEAVTQQQQRVRKCNLKQSANDRQSNRVLFSLFLFLPVQVTACSVL
jgi:hypothetical protein